jgi:small subunit ribosomal protein S19e
MGIYDVPAKYIIEEMAEKLQKEIEQPNFAYYVKSGASRERAPERKDWFYVRMGSILYRTYKWNVIGTEKLRSYYGGRKRRGLKTEHQMKASGKVIRTAVQKLEEAGYLEKAKPKGRQLTKKGLKELNNISKIVTKNIEEGKYKHKKHIVKEDKEAKAVHEELKKHEKKETPKNKKKEKVKKNE